MKKKIGLLVSVFVAMGVVALISFNYYNNQYYAKRLITAIKDDNYEQVEKLLSSPTGNINSFPVWNIFWQMVVKEKYVLTPLQEACQKGNYEIIKLLIYNDADVNKIGTSSYSPLMFAVTARSERRLEIIRLLVDNGADIEYQNAWSNALVLAAETDLIDSVLLIEYFETKGKDLTESYRMGSLLHYACYGGNSEVIRYLVETKGLNINGKNHEGKTPLITFSLPVGSKKLDDLKYLLESGADKFIKDDEGKTAYDYAIQSKDSEFVELLKP